LLKVEVPTRKRTLLLYSAFPLFSFLDTLQQSFILLLWIFSFFLIMKCDRSLPEVFEKIIVTNSDRLDLSASGMH